MEGLDDEGDAKCVRVRGFKWRQGKGSTHRVKVRVRVRDQARFRVQI